MQDVNQRANLLVQSFSFTEDFQTKISYRTFFVETAEEILDGGLHDLHDDVHPWRRWLGAWQVYSIQHLGAKWDKLTMFTYFHHSVFKWVGGETLNLNWFDFPGTIGRRLYA